jgi:3-methyl-2-oxobutanoate hydroxymethyltransferase
VKNIYTYGDQPVKRNLTVADLQQQRGKKKFTQVTADTFEEAAAAAAAGIDTISCGLNEYSCVRAGAPDLFITTALLPTEFIGEDDIIRAALKVMEAGSDAIFTGRSLRIIEALAKEGVPVMGHIGMRPRFSTWYGSLNVRGKSAEDASALHQQFRDLEDAGAFAVEVELVAQEALLEISRRTNLVTFCLGSGSAGDVDFLFACDALGETERLPRHAKAFGNLRVLHEQLQQSRIEAFSAFQQAVETGAYPTSEQSSSMLPGEWEKFLHQLSKS